MIYTAAEAAGMPTLLRDGQPVAYLDDGTLSVSPMFAEQAFETLTRVYAPDEATVERLGRTVAEYDGHNWDTAHPDEQDAYVEHVNVTLAALAGIRDTDTETGGAGNEHRRVHPQAP